MRTQKKSVASSESCFLQRCLGCHPQETVWPGSSVECTPSNWVTAEWVHKLGHPPPSTGSRFNVEMRCLKMVATPDDKSFGNTIDTLKGCVPKAQVDSVCLGLVAIERARGHSDARCFICNGNDCNSAINISVGKYTYLLSAILFFVLR
ncbi:hypothetical protein KGM_200423 [Danaus plexippus plexippus]|uniref:Protein quiver n=1 Tax=Danaus plexippus plexippus TaxID=278856 RepID=A0A212FPR7_DANPL|nr:hypothetical protein KGM_200423 [Danaus plexippus plexippus]